MTTSHKQESQDAVRQWLRHVLDAKNWTPSQLAQASGISKSTVSRALNDDTFVTTTTTLVKISNASGIPAPRIGASTPATGFAEEELGAADPPEGVANLGANEFWREVRSTGLSAIGIIPGDVVRVDMAQVPQPGDVVCAQIYDHETGSARTVLRQFDPPFLQTRALDQAAHRRPVLVDGVQAKVMGVVTLLKRIFTSRK